MKRKMRRRNSQFAKIAVSLMLALMLLCGDLAGIATNLQTVSAESDTQIGTPSELSPTDAPTEQPTEPPAQEGKKAQPPTAPGEPTEIPDAVIDPTQAPVESSEPTEEQPKTPAATSEATDAPTAEPPAETVEQTEQPTEAPNTTSEPTETPVAEETPAPETDERSPLQRMIEDEDGAYVDVQSGAIYERRNFYGRMGRIGSGLAFATAYIEHDDGEDAIHIMFRTENDILEQGYIPASRATERDRTQTVDQLTQSGETFLFSVNPDLPLTVLAFEPKEPDAQEEPTPTPVAAEEPAVENDGPFSPMDYEGTMLGNLINNGDGFYSFTNAGGETLLLAYGSVEGGEPAFYVVNMDYEIDLTQPITAEELLAQAPVVDEEVDQNELLSAPFVSLTYEGELPASIAANSDGTYTHTAEDGTVTLLAYGSVNGGLPLFYPVAENGELLLDAPFIFDASVDDDALTDEKITFVPVTPDEDVIPPFYHKVQSSIGTLGFLKWLIPSANAEGTAVFEATDYFEVELENTTVYRVYGSLNGGDPAWYAYDPDTKALAEPVVPIDPFEMDALLLAVEPFADGDSQSLVAEFRASKPSYKAGAEMTMRLTTSLSSTNNEDYADVYIKVPDIPGIDLPQFTAANGYTYEFKGVRIELIEEDGSRYLRYHLGVGDPISNCFIKVVVPNGITANGTEVAFAFDEGKTVCTAPGTPQYKVENAKVTASFEWRDVTISALPGTVSVTSAMALKEDVRYTISANNTYNYTSSGVIYTEKQKVTGKITLPAGISWPSGDVTYSGSSIYIGGKLVATLSKNVSSAELTDGKLVYTWEMSNDSLETTKAYDMRNLNLTLTLKGENLSVDTSALAQNAQIGHEVIYEATPYTTAETHQSKNAAQVDIEKPVAIIGAHKSNSPTNSTTVASLDTPIMYTVTVSNTGAAADTVDVRDLIPQNTVYFADATHVPTENIELVKTAGDVVTEVKWTNVTIPVGGSKTFTFYVKPKAGIADGAYITNAAQVYKGGNLLTESNTVRNYYNATDRLDLGKTHTGGNFYSHKDVVTFQISLANNANIPTNKAHDLVDTLPLGLNLTAEQQQQIKDALAAMGYPDTTVEKNANGQWVITVPGITLKARETFTFTFDATVNADEKDAENCGIALVNNQAITNLVTVPDLSLSAQNTIRYADQVHDVTLAKSHGEITQIAADTFSIPYKISVTNNGDSTENLLKPMVFRDVMNGGLHPTGIDMNATSGTVTGTDSRGNTITGTWRRYDNSAYAEQRWNYPYYYEVEWMVPKEPALQTGETYSVEYTAEVNVQLQANGNYLARTVRNDLYMYDQTVETEIVLRRKLSLTKSITEVNGKATDDRFSYVYPEDWITYTIKLANGTNAPITGKLEDFLPEPKGGSGFAWKLGENVTVNAGPNADRIKADTPGLMEWDSITVPAMSGETEGSVTVQVQLKFPAADVFYNAFGLDGTVFDNYAEFTNERFIVFDDVEHETRTLDLAVKKSVSNSRVDSAAENPIDREVTFTISDFTFSHAMENVRLTESLDDVRRNFEIINIDPGWIIVTGEDGNAAEYEVIYTYADGHTDNFPVATDGRVQPPITPSDVVTIEWAFGNKVRGVAFGGSTSDSAPTILCRAKEKIYGMSTNMVTYGWLNKQTSASASVSVVNSNAFTKRLLDQNGNEVNNTDNYAEAGKTYTWEICFHNYTGEPIDLKDVSIYENLAVAGLVKDAELKVHIKHLNANQAKPVEDVAQPATITEPLSDWEDGKFNIGFTGGVLQPDDTLYITFDVTTNEDFKKSAEEGDQTYPMKNSARLSVGDKQYDAVSPEYRAERIASLYLQKSVVGITEHEMDFHSVDDLEDRLDNFITSGGIRYFIYNVTLCNTHDSTVSVELPKEAIFKDVVKAQSSYNTDYGDWFDLRGFGSQGVISGRVGTQNSGIDGLPNANGYSYPSLDNNDMVFTVSTVGNKKGKWNLTPAYDKPAVLEPGQMVTFYMVVMDPPPERVSDWWWDVLEGLAHVVELTNTIELDTKLLKVPTGTRFEKGEVELKVPVYDDVQKPNTGYSDNVGDCVLSSDGILSSSVTIHQQQSKLGVTKEFLGYYKGAEAEAIARSLPNPLDVTDPYEGLTIQTKDSPDVNDYLVWKATYTNSGETYIYGDGLFDVGLEPAGDYDLVLVCLEKNNQKIYFDASKATVLGITDTFPMGERDNFLDFRRKNNEFVAGFAASYDPNYTGWYPLKWEGDTLVLDKDNRIEPRLAPGETCTLTTVWRPRGTGGYQSYTNSAFIQSELCQWAEMTEGVRDWRQIRAYSTVELGGAMATSSQKQVAQNGLEVTSKDANIVLDVDGSATFTYTLRVENKGEITLKNFTFIDRLPMSGDGGVLNTASARNSYFTVRFADDPQVKVEKVTASGTPTSLTDVFTCAYKYAGQRDSFTDEDWNGAGNEWVSTPASYHNAIRIHSTNNNATLSPNEAFLVTFSVKIPDAKYYIGKVAYNSFGYCYSGYVAEEGIDKTLKAEPGKVGVRVKGAKVAVNKASLEDNKPLGGAEFTIYSDEGCTVSVGAFTTGSDGYGESSLLLTGTYWVKETKAPAGYTLENTPKCKVDLTNVDHGAVINIATGSLYEDGKVPMYNQKEKEPDPVVPVTPVRLIVTKAMASGSTMRDESITIQVTGVFDNSNGAEVTRTAVFTPEQADGKTQQIVYSLIPGNEYTITEANSGYTYTLTAKDDAGAAVSITDGTFTAPQTDTYLAVVNTERKSKLFIQKSVVGKGAGETFTISVSGVFADKPDRQSKTYQIAPENYGTAIEVEGVLWGQNYTVAETYGGEYYETTYQVNSGTLVTDDKVAVKLDEGRTVVTVTNTPKKPGKLLIQKRLGESTNDPGTPFTVRVAGTFSDTADAYKDVTVNAGGSAEITGVIPGMRYTVNEVLVGNVYLVTYEGLDGTNGLTVTLNDQTVVVTNTLRNSGELRVTKSVQSNTLSTIETYTFRLRGPEGVDYTGTVTTGTSGKVSNWVKTGTDEKVLLTNLPLGQYTLAEVPAADSNYQLAGYTVINGVGGSITSTDNSITFTLERGANATAAVTVSNAVKTGSVTVKKAFKDHLGNNATSAAAQTFYAALYRHSELAPAFTPKPFEWDDASKAYKPVTFENVPYGEYEVREVLSAGEGNWDEASAVEGFPYTVTQTGEQVTVANATTAPEVTVTNTLRSANASLSAQKRFATQADGELLQDKTFTIRVWREDGASFTADGKGELAFTLAAGNTPAWGASIGNVKLPAGTYLFAEDTNAAEAEGWENTALSGAVDGAPLNVTGEDDYTGTFEITADELEQNIQIDLTATNKANYRLINFELYKKTDKLNTANKTFTFEITDSKGALVGTGRIAKTTADSEKITVWENGFDPAAYRWIIGETYQIKEDVHNQYTLTAINGDSVTALYEGEGEARRLVGASFTVTETLNALSVEFENTQNVTNPLKLKKKVVDEDGNQVDPGNWLANSRFTFEVYEKNEDDEMVLLGTLVRIDGAEENITTTEPLLMGGTYYIREAEAYPVGAYTLQSIRAGDATLTEENGYYAFTAASNLTILAVNTMSSAAISVSKTQVGGTAGQRFQFTLKVNGDLYSGAYMVQDSQLETTDGTFELSHDQTATFYGVKENDAFEVTESNAEGYETTVAVGNAKPSNGKTGTGTVNGLTSVAFTNTASLLDVKLAKQVTGNMASREQKFTFTIALQDADGKALAQGTEITVAAGATEGTTPPSYTKLTLDADGTAKVELAHGQNVTLKNLDKTWKLQVTETSYAALGYSTSYSDSLGKKDQKENSTGFLDLGDAKWLADKGEYQLRTITYTNSQSVSVPTGILMDIWPYLLIVLAAIIGGACLMASRKKRRRRDDDGWNE